MNGDVTRPGLLQLGKTFAQLAEMVNIFEQEHERCERIRAVMSELASVTLKFKNGAELYIPDELFLVQPSPKPDRKSRKTVNVETAEPVSEPVTATEEREQPPSPPKPELTPAQKFLRKLVELRHPITMEEKEPRRKFGIKQCRLCNVSFNPTGPRDLICFNCRSSYGPNVMRAIEEVERFKKEFEKKLTVTDTLLLPHTLRWHFAQHWSPEQRAEAKKIEVSSRNLDDTIERFARESRPLGFDAK